MKLTPLDILLIGIVIYIVIGAIRRRGGRPGGPMDRRGPGQGPGQGRPTPPEENRRQANDAYQRAQRTWDMLRSEDQRPKDDSDRPEVQDVAYVPGQEQSDAQAQPAPAPKDVPSTALAREDVPPEAAGTGALPEGFDEREFLRGAQAFSVRIRGAWNARDLMDLRQFCTEDGMEEFRRRAQMEARPPRHEILSVNTGLVEVRSLGGGAEEASVYYEFNEKDLSSNHTEQVREIWRFVQTPGTSWLLDGVRPVDAAPQSAPQ